MANTDTPMGLRPKRYLSGGPYNGAVTRYYVPATDTTAIYVGGLVKSAGSGDSDGVPSVTGNVSTGDAVIGVVVAIDSVTSDSLIYRAASTERYVFVADDPNLVFECQEDGTSAATDIGSTADLTGFTSGSTTTGRSSIEISSSSVTATGDGTEDVLIVGLARRPDNEIGANAVYEVRLNNHFFVDGVAGA